MNMIHVRIVSPVVVGTARDPAELKALERPGLAVSRVKIKHGPASIESEFEDALAVPETVALIVQAVAERADAAVIDCMADPGLHAAREAVTIPVLGPCETGMHVAASLGHKFSIVTALARGRPTFENLARLYGCADKLASVRAVDLPVLELDDDRERMTRLLGDEARRAVVEDHADCILFGCSGMFGAAQAVREALLADGIDVPVIDPVPTAVRVAAALVEAGLSHSKTAYPPPPQKPRPGYEYILDSGKAAAAE